ncbi:MAG: hypothetical protein JWM95_5039 [Gemmatimonadetes bacterium]|nr:hypothetical protein [Gemmatimonadota bacterium]
MASTLTFGTHLTGTSYDGSVPVTIGTDATSTPTASTLVARDASGNFEADDITADAFFAAGKPWFDVTTFLASPTPGHDNQAAFMNAFAALPPGGGTVFVPFGIYEINSTIVPAVNLDERLSCKTRLLLAEGAVLWYMGADGTPLFRIENVHGQDGAFYFEGGVFDGYRGGINTIGVEVRVNNVRFRRVTIRRFGYSRVGAVSTWSNGVGILFSTPAAPTICCAIEQSLIISTGNGVRSEVHVNGLDIIDSWIEASGQEGLYFKNASKVTMFGGGVEGSGSAPGFSSVPEVKLLGDVECTLDGVWFETFVEADKTIIYCDGDVSTPVTSLVVRDCHVNGYETDSSVSIDVGAEHRVMSFEATSNWISAASTGIRIGADVRNFSVGPQSWGGGFALTTPIALSASNTYPGTIAATPFGGIRGLQRVSAASFEFVGGSFEFSGGPAQFSDNISLGNTIVDQATGAGNYYDVLTMAGRVTGGAAVRANLYSSDHNTAIFNVAANTTSALGTTITYADGVGGIVRTADATPLYLGANGGATWRITTAGHLESTASSNIGSTTHVVGVGYFGAVIAGTNALSSTSGLTVLAGGVRVASTGTAKLVGSATLVAGTVTISTTSVGANSKIFITRTTTGGTIGDLRVSAISAGTSFTVASASGTDTSSFNWFIVEAV